MKTRNRVHRKGCTKESVQQVHNGTARKRAGQGRAGRARAGGIDERGSAVATPFAASAQGGGAGEFTAEEAAALDWVAQARKRRCAVNARSRFLRREPDKAQERALRICIKDRRTREQLRSISSDAVESAATELQELARQLTAYAAARGAMLKAGVPDEGVRIGKN